METVQLMALQVLGAMLGGAVFWGLFLGGLRMSIRETARNLHTHIEGCKDERRQDREERRILQEKQDGIVKDIHTRISDNASKQQQEHKETRATISKLESQFSGFRGELLGFMRKSSNLTDETHKGIDQ